MKKEILERFTRYVKIHTTSEDEVEQIPSTNRQFDLARLIEEELKAIGVENVKVSDHCYVTGTIPASEGYEGKQTVGFISHLDTAPDFSGENVKPVIHENYNGEDVVLGDSGRVIKVSEFPDLKNLKGRTLITADGTTLLGADDKAGITAIVTAANYLLNHPEEKHGEIRICFTPDEEVGRGSDKFDVKAFGADYAFTVDGDDESEVAYENFNAASCTIKIDGVNVHPGEAKGIMVNAGYIGTVIAQMVPKKEIPALTEGREGFYHLFELKGDVAHAELYYILRDHDKDCFEERKKVMQEICDKVSEMYPKAKITCEIKDSYENMISVINEHKDVVELAKEAISAQGLTPISRPIRGGTDGAMLSFKGLPCPNLGTGGYGFHGPFEHVTLEGMETVVNEIIYIAKHPL